MWALVEDSEIVKIINNPKAMVIGDTRHSRKIFSLWSVAEKEAKGIYEVVFDNTNKKDEAYYTNTNQTFAFADGAVTASYGSATARSLADTLFTAQDEIDGKGIEGEVAVNGLKTNHKEIIKQQASGLLTPTDWYVIKATDVESYSVPSAITTFRTNVRTRSNEMEVLIDACSTVDELVALYVYTDGTKPLGEFPEAV